jgi:hypothetical protein
MLQRNKHAELKKTKKQHEKSRNAKEKIHGSFLHHRSWLITTVRGSVNY